MIAMISAPLPIYFIVESYFKVVSRDKVEINTVEKENGGLNFVRSGDDGSEAILVVGCWQFCW